MKPPPPMPATKGSVTPSTALAAIAASTALPPSRRTSMPARVASASTEATAPPVPTATASLGGWGAAGARTAPPTSTVANASNARSQPASRSLTVSGLLLVRAANAALARTGQTDEAARRADEDLAAVHGVVGTRVAPDLVRVAKHRVDVQRRRVVAEERPPVIARGAVCVQVVGRSEDRVARIVDVPAQAVGAPRRGQELHRTLRARRARVPELVEGRLDEVHGREHPPRDVEPALALGVVAAQPVRSLGPADAEAAERLRPGELHELAVGRDLAPLQLRSSRRKPA